MSAEAQQESEDAVASAKAVAWSGGSLLLITLIKPAQSGTTRLALFVPVLVTVLSRIWSLIVTYYVPDPYLVRQYQDSIRRYCADILTG